MILLNTCCLLWLVAQPDRMSARALECVAENPNGLFVSSISAFEIALKHKRGKLALPIETTKWFPAALDHLGLREIEPNAEILIASANLPDPHKDPCDRIIAATAKVHNLCCLTPDALIRQYAVVKTEW